MPDEDGSSVRSWDPREIETLAGVYRAVIEGAGEAGLLAALPYASMSGRDLRRLLAREVIASASAGLRSSQEIVAHVLARLSGPQTVTA